MQNPETAYMTYHCNIGPQHIGYSYTGQELADEGWHTYSMQWTPDILIWYIDGIQRFNTTTCIPNYPMFILANLAIGGNWPGAPDATTPFPTYMDIDYIRAYKFVPSGGVSLTGPGDGLPFTNAPTIAPRGLVTFRNPTLSKDYVTRGDNVTISVTLDVGGAGLNKAIVQAFVQPWMDTQHSIVGYNFMDVTVAAGSSQTLSFVATIPNDTADGYYRVGYGIFSEGWSNTLMWQNVANALGVNAVIGGTSK